MHYQYYSGLVRESAVQDCISPQFQFSVGNHNRTLNATSLRKVTPLSSYICVVFQKDTYFLLRIFNCLIRHAAEHRGTAINVSRYVLQCKLLTAINLIDELHSKILCLVCKIVQGLGILYVRFCQNPQVTVNLKTKKFIINQINMRIKY